MNSLLPMQLACWKLPKGSRRLTCVMMPLSVDVNDVNGNSLKGVEGFGTSQGLLVITYGGMRKLPKGSRRNILPT